MKTWFFGSGMFAALCFREIAAQIRFEKVITLPPRPAGRGNRLRPTPLEEEALLLGYQPIHSAKPSSEPALLEELENAPPDLALVIDFSSLITEPLLNGPRLGCFNIHPSLLPEYRGAAPIQRALMDGKTATGVTVFRLVQSMDAGPIIARSLTQVGPETTAGELTEKLAREGSQIFLKSLKCLCGGYAEYIAQDDQAATKAPKLDKLEERIDWNKTGERVHNLVRALNPSPGAYCLHQGKRLKVWKTLPVEGTFAHPGSVVRLEGDSPVVACSQGAILLLEVQPEGRNPASGKDWARGSRIRQGDVLE